MYMKFRKIFKIVLHISTDVFGILFFVFVILSTNVMSFYIIQLLKMNFTINITPMDTY